MAIPRLLIEYLINGALSLIWLVPLLNRYSLLETPYYSVGNMNIGIIAILLYFLGMFIDTVAYHSTRDIKKIIRKIYLGTLEMKKEYKRGESYAREARFAIYAPELSKEVLKRSSRDRIARGAIINSIFGTAAFMVIADQIFYPLIFGICLIDICFFMWKGFEEVSYGFEMKGQSILDQKIEAEKNNTK